MNVDEWSRIRRLRESGMAIKAIARHLGRSRNTVRRALSLDQPPSDGRRRRACAADEYESRIVGILAGNPATAATEIAAQISWPHSMTVLRQRVRALRSTGSAGGAGIDRRSPPERLPAELTTFVGRRGELAAIRQELQATRLLTLTGCGGIGKTRLALKVAEQVRRAFADGVRCVELAGLSDRQLLAQTIVDQLGLAHHDGTIASPANVLADYLRTRQTLLVIDNCEHLVESCCELLGQLLVVAGELKVLATSRQALGQPGERLYVVGPLAVAESPTRDRDSDPAVSLFVERATAVVPGFRLDESDDAAVRRICRQLDGVPLGIELAAIQLRALSVRDLDERLGEHVLGLSTRGGAGSARHRSLDAAMDWSYALCSSTEQTVWARASIFVGGFDLRACETVCGDSDLTRSTVLDAVQGLVEKSILQREEHDGQVRFGMLEPLRESGRGRLSEIEVAGCRARHLDWCVGLIGQLAGAWFGAEQETWYRRIRREQPNLRAALDFATGDGGAVRSAQKLVADAWFLWAILSLEEHRHWLERVRELSIAPSSERARLLATLGLVMTLQGERVAANDWLAQSEQIARELDDPIALAYAVHEQGLVEFFSGNFVRSREQLLSALTTYEHRGASPDLIGSLRVHLGLLGVFDGHLDWAERQLQWILARCEANGERWLAAYAHSGIGFVELARGDFDAAAERAATALAMMSGFRDAIGVSLPLDLLAWAEAARGRSDRAAVLLGAASGMWRSFGEQLYGSEHWVAGRDRFERMARAGLGGARFETAVRRGTAMTRAQILNYALNLMADVDPGAGENHDSDLTTREREIVELVAAGLTNKQVAFQLVISHRTVEGHVGNALCKLGFERRSQLATWAVEHRSAFDPADALSRPLATFT